MRYANKNSAKINQPTPLFLSLGSHVDNPREKGSEDSATCGSGLAEAFRYSVHLNVSISMPQV